ncbi:MAG: DnaB-like helicase C-terminal domain-containing protein [Bacteroidetes bacterium]|nr:DnaB-like helicase C-terminal domain-containing protein [Bacteroidota bacterium]
MKEKIIQTLEGLISNKNNTELELYIQIKNLVYEYEQQNNILKESSSIADLILQTIANLKENKQAADLIKTGYADLDEKLGGVSPGELIVLGGRPGMGKTQFMVNLALSFSKEFPVLYFTYDLSEYLLMIRFISAISGIAAQRILFNKMSDEELVKVNAIQNSHFKNKIFINDSCNNAFSSFRAICEKKIKEDGVKIIMVDYLQMMGSNKFRNNREMEISYITRELKNIAKDFGVCVIAASQLSRAVETRGGDKIPHLSDLRESGAIEQDADKVIFIYRPEYYGIDADQEGNSTAGITDLVIAKNRNGILGTTRLIRNANASQFSNFSGFKVDFEFSSSRLDELN